MAQVEKSIIIGAPLERVFEFWSRLEEFPRILPFVKEVRRTGPNTYRWRISGPAQRSIAWEAEVSKFVPNEQIGWRALSADVHNSGMVVFQRIQQGTRVSVVLKFEPPAGQAASFAAWLLGEPEQMLDQALKSIKAELEKVHVEV